MLSDGINTCQLMGPQKRHYITLQVNVSKHKHKNKQLRMLKNPPSVPPPPESDQTTNRRKPRAETRFDSLFERPIYGIDQSIIIIIIIVFWYKSHHNLTSVKLARFNRVWRDVDARSVCSGEPGE